LRRPGDPDRQLGRKKPYPGIEDLPAPSMIQTGKKYGMQLLDDAIQELLTKAGSAGRSLHEGQRQAAVPAVPEEPATDFTEA